MPHTQGNPVKVKKPRGRPKKVIADVVEEPKVAKAKKVKPVVDEVVEPVVKPKVVSDKEKKPRKKSEWQTHLAATYEKNKGNDAKYKYSSAMKDAKLTYKKSEAPKTEEL